MNEILEQLEINKTFFYQFALFGFFFLILREIYLKPFQKLIQKRNQKLKADMEGSAELLKTIENRLAEYNRALSEARAEASRTFEANIAHVRAREEAEINKLKEEIKKDYLKRVHDLQEERLKVESELKLQLGGMSDSLAQKILAGN
jgi:F-type H+-transporting ATPase subunit b